VLLVDIALFKSGKISGENLASAAEKVQRAAARAAKAAGKAK
jgi:hypothetical protein